jgi:hypothetical protein
VGMIKRRLLICSCKGSSTRSIGWCSSGRRASLTLHEAMLPEMVLERLHSPLGKPFIFA